MNYFAAASTLHNTYFVMRHGQSQANVRGLIISHPKNGALDEFGLTEVGREQVRRSAQASALPQDVIIYSSDFSRARQTADIVRQVTGAGAVIVSEDLRERHFGGWERTNSENYELVWHDDATNASHTINHVESIEAVLTRATRLVVELERLYTHRTILLVSHGDTLQILQTGFGAVSPSEHRSLRHLETAEIRQMQLVV